MTVLSFKASKAGEEKMDESNDKPLSWFSVASRVSLDVAVELDKISSEDGDELLPKYHQPKITSTKTTAMEIMRFLCDENCFNILFKPIGINSESKIVNGIVGGRTESYAVHVDEA